MEFNSTTGTGVTIYDLLRATELPVMDCSFAPASDFMDCSSCDTYSAPSDFSSARSFVINAATAVRLGDASCSARSSVISKTSQRSPTWFPSQCHRSARTALGASGRARVRRPAARVRRPAALFRRRLPLQALHSLWPTSGVHSGIPGSQTLKSNVGGAWRRYEPNTSHFGHVRLRLPSHEACAYFA